MLKKLKSLFFVEEEGGSDKIEAAEKKKSQAAPKSPAQKSTKASDSSSMSNPSAAPSKKFIDVLLKAIEANNLEGFDYLEFKQSLQSLAKMDMDEVTRYQSALAMAKTMGADKKSLVSSGKHYLKVLQQEQQKFMQAHQSQQSKQVGDRENKIKQLENLIKEKNQKIAALQKEIEADKKSLETEKATINKAVAKVSATKDGFLAAFNQVSKQIEKDIAKIQQHLS